MDKFFGQFEYIGTAITQSSSDAFWDGTLMHTNQSGKTRTTNKEEFTHPTGQLNVSHHNRHSPDQQDGLTYCGLLRDYVATRHYNLGPSNAQDYPTKTTITTCILAASRINQALVELGSTALVN